MATSAVAGCVTAALRVAPPPRAAASRGCPAARRSAFLAGGALSSAPTRPAALRRAAQPVRCVAASQTPAATQPDPHRHAALPRARKTRARRAEPAEAQAEAEVEAGAEAALQSTRQATPHAWLVLRLAR
jgi:hypothetical protein